jgi:NTE family protein
MNIRALALSGGSIKGAFQAGAIHAVIESGFRPQSLYGISVGSLNTTFLNHEAGRQGVSFEKLDWNRISENLVGFWAENVTRPSDLVKKHCVLKNIFSAISGDFDGLVSTAPLKKLIYKTIDPEILRKSPLKQYVGAVNIMNGEFIYADPSFPDFLDYVIASTAMPIIMPGQKIRSRKDQPFFDGGLRDIVPVKRAIMDKAETIVCILCQPEDPALEPFNEKNILKLSERVIDIMTDEIERNDIEQVQKINRFVPADGTPAATGPYQGKRKIDLRVIRPPSPIRADITKFTADNIRQMIDLGYNTAKELMKRFSS